VNKIAQRKLPNYGIGNPNRNYGRNYGRKPNGNTRYFLGRHPIKGWIKVEATCIGEAHSLNPYCLEWREVGR